MENILYNIHNIDDTHVSDHHNWEEFICERPETVSQDTLDASRRTYIEELNKYYNLHFYKRVFTRKPQEPVINSYLYY